MNVPSAVTAVAAATPGGPGIAAVPPDPRLRELTALVDSGDFDVLSLDVFDTLVWRAVPEPRDVFLEVARAAQERGMLFASSSRASFAAERVRSEERARKRAASREVTLEDIYAQFPRGYLAAGATADLVDLERAVERSLVRVHEDVATLAAHARTRGLRIALVSDTYFSNAFIRELTGIDADFVIVSCEHGLSKHQGLHRVLLRDSGVAAGRILHVGDNELADIEGPAVFGIARFWLRKVPGAYSEMLAREVPSHWAPREEVLRDTDAGITMLRGRAQARAATPYERWGAGVLGPLLAGFGEWIAERCAAREVRKALCLMREGTLLTQVLDTIRSGVDAHETYLSRYSALRASIFTGSAEEILAFVARPSAQPAREVLRQLGLTPQEVPRIAPDAPLTRSEVQVLARTLAADRALRERIVSESARARARLLLHIARLIPLREPQTVAIVDLGYKGTIQGALQAIFDHEGLPLRTHGLYLVTNAGVSETQAHGAIAEGWLAENGQPTAMAHTFIRSPEVFEQSLMANCGTTLGHGDDGTPLLGAQAMPAEQRAQIDEVQRGALLYARMWAAHRRTIAVPASEQLRPLFQAMCVRAVARPLDEELRLFGAWQHDDNFGTDTVVTLAEPRGLHPWEAEHLSAHQLASLPHEALYWPFAYAHAGSPAMGEAVAQIFLRTAPPHAFDAATGTRPLVVLRNLGHGFRDEDTEVHEVTPGNRNAVWFRARHGYTGDGPQAYAFAVALPGEVLRVRGVALHAIDGSGHTTDTYIPADDLTFVGFRHLHGALWLAEDDPALVVCPTPALAQHRGVVHADIFFTLCEAA